MNMVKITVALSDILKTVKGLPKDVKVERVQRDDMHAANLVITISSSEINLKRDDIPPLEVWQKTLKPAKVEKKEETEA